MDFKSCHLCAIRPHVGLPAATWQPWAPEGEAPRSTGSICVPSGFPIAAIARDQGA